MAARKTRARPKSQPKRKISIHLDPQRQEEIAAIAVAILAALTALGAFDLSDGTLLTPWVRFLQTLLGWGVYFTPILLLALAGWLLFDALDKIVNIGWERPIGLAMVYLWLVAVLHWISVQGNPVQMPVPSRGGGLVGWAITSVLVQALGTIGGAVALGAFVCIALILLLNISFAETARRLASAARRISIPRLSWLARRERSARDLVPPAPSFGERRRPSTLPEETPTPRAKTPHLPVPVDDAPEDEEQVEPSPVAARLIGGDLAPASNAPVTPLMLREWHLPVLTDILEESTEQEISEPEIRSRVRVIEETLAHFGVPAQVTEVNQGPTITQFGVEPGFVEQKGIDGKIHRVKIKVSRISALQHDLELALAAAPIRIEAPVPGRSVVGIEVPNSQVGMVSLRGILESDEFGKMKGKLRIALGQDVAGQPICGDLATMPHLLIAGATGSGKSVCVNSIIAALLCTTTPAQVQFVMIDPKRVELINYNGIPHLIGRVVVEVDGAVGVLQDAVAEMDRRFKLFAAKGARNIELYNHIVEDQPADKLPFQIVIVDELADLMMVAAGEVEHAITRLAQMARATGIHLILATQRPSVDVVTGIIKANFPARISFAVTSQIDSRVVLDTPGAEKLLGRGDMLYMASDSSKLFRLQGCYVSDRELDRLVSYWKAFAPPEAADGEAPRPDAHARRTPGETAAGTNGNTASTSGATGDDALLAQAIEVVQANKRASVSFLQRKLRIGYARAARLMEQLEAQGLVGPDQGPTKGRSVLETKSPPAPASHRATPGRAQASQGDDEDEGDFADWTDADWEDLDKG